MTSVLIDNRKLNRLNFKETGPYCEGKSETD